MATRLSGVICRAAEWPAKANGRERPIEIWMCGGAVCRVHAGREESIPASSRAPSRALLVGPAPLRHALSKEPTLLIISFKTAATELPKL